MIDMEELVERLIVKNAELMSLREDFASVKALLKIESEANNRANDELTRAKDLVRRMVAGLDDIMCDEFAAILDEYDAMIGKPKTLSETITSAAVTLGECQAEWMADPD
jgi:hypothetical protein